MARTRASLVRPVARKAARTGTRNVGRAVAQGSFDQYLVDIQRLPMITDPAEERALARRALSGDQIAAERLVTANLRFVIAYVRSSSAPNPFASRCRTYGASPSPRAGGASRVCAWASRAAARRSSM